MKKKLLFYYLLFSSILVFAQPVNYIIDFGKDTPVFNFVNDQLAEVTGSVLLNDGTFAPAGFGYKISMSITGGPDGSSPVQYLLQDNSGPNTAMAASKFDAGGTKIREEFGGVNALSFAFLGRELTGSDYTYLRDPSSNMRFTLELTNGLDLEDITYTLGDMDYIFKNDDATSTCFGPTDNENYNCRYTYIDQITVISGAGSNQYTFKDASKIHQVNDASLNGSGVSTSRSRMGDTFYANFPDANNDQVVDEEVDGRIPGTDDSGNITVYNPGNIGSQIIFEYSDPGYALAGDTDGYHDYDSYNQVMSFLSGTSFTANSCASAPLALSLTDTDIIRGETVCVTIAEGSSNVVWTPSTGVTRSGDQYCFTPTVNTTYIAKSTDSGCNYEAQFEVRVWDPSCNVTLSLTQTDIYRNQEVCVTVTGPTNYSVSPTTGARKLGNQLCLQPLTTTTYTVVSADVAGCPQQEQVTVTVWNEASTVPTMSQWGLIIFGLLILNIGVFFIFEQERILIK